MKTKYKYIHFRYVGKSISGKTETWEIYNHYYEDNTYLGFIKWNGAWRQYTSYLCTSGAGTYIQVSRGCHEDISNFIKQLMDKRRKK